MTEAAGNWLVKNSARLASVTNVLRQEVACDGDNLESIIFGIAESQDRKHVGFALEISSANIAYRGIIVDPDWISLWGDEVINTAAKTNEPAIDVINEVISYHAPVIDTQSTPFLLAVSIARKIEALPSRPLFSISQEGLFTPRLAGLVVDMVNQLAGMIVASRGRDVPFLTRGGYDGNWATGTMEVWLALENPMTPRWETRMHLIKIVRF